MENGLVIFIDGLSFLWDTSMGFCPYSLLICTVRFRVSVYLRWLLTVVHFGRCKFHYFHAKIFYFGVWGGYLVKLSLVFNISSKCVGFKWKRIVHLVCVFVKS